MSAHKYWRINIFARNNASSGNVSIAEIEMRATVGGADQCNGGTASASSTNGTAVADRAFDNATGVAWESLVCPVWIMYEFVDPVDVAEIQIWPRSALYSFSPKDFALEFSDDGVNFTAAVYYSNVTDWNTTSPGVPKTFSAFISTLSGSIIESLPITDWHIVANRCADGAMVGHGFSSGSTYSVETITLEACNITLAPKINYAWSAAKVAVVGDYVVAVNPDATPYLWKCTSVTGDAKTGANQPAWNLSGTTTDGNVTWTYVGPLIDPLTLGPKIPDPK